MSQEGTTVESVAATSALFCFGRLEACSVRSPAPLHQTPINRAQFGLGGISYRKSKTRRSQRRSAARRCRTHRSHRPAPSAAACLLCRRLSLMKLFQSTMVRGETPKCHATWCDGTPAAHEKRIQTSFPRSILLLK